MADDDDWKTMKASQATDDRGIFRKSLVAVELDEVFKQSLDEIECVRPIRMTRELNSLKGCSLLIVSCVLCLRILLALAQLRLVYGIVGSPAPGPSLSASGI